jgi:hypothetical protein
MNVTVMLYVNDGMLHGLGSNGPRISLQRRVLCVSKRKFTGRRSDTEYLHARHDEKYVLARLSALEIVSLVVYQVSVTRMSRFQGDKLSNFGYWTH